jgi:hypothetical protein
MCLDQRLWTHDEGQKEVKKISINHQRPNARTNETLVRIDDDDDDDVDGLNLFDF